MYRRLIFTVACTLLLAGAETTVAQEASRPSFAEQLEAWLPGMGAESIPDRKDSQQALQAALYERGAPGREAELTEACKAVATKLGPETAKPARVWMLSQLEFNGGAECVNAVAACLKDNDPEIRDCACRALQNNPDASANACLLAALASPVDNAQAVAVANGLGYRKDPASVPALKKLLTGSPENLARAAANALGSIGTAAAADALQAALPDAAESVKGNLADALLRTADAMLANGKRVEAQTIYKQLDMPAYGRATRLAALEGKLNTTDSVVKMVVSLLAEADPDPDRQAVGAQRAGELSGEETTTQLTEQFSKLPTSGQVLLLGALASRGDISAAPLAIKATSAADQAVRIAGIQAMARLGSAKAAELLIKIYTEGGSEGDAARQTLRMIYGKGVDEALIAAMKKADTSLRGTLIDVLRERRAATAAPALLDEATSSDNGIRDRAVRALGELAGPEDIGPMIAILLATEKGRQRDDIEKAIARTCHRTSEPDALAAPVLAIVRKSSPQDRIELLSLLGRIGGSDALAEIQKAIASNNAEEKDAGVRAICNWPDATVADELLAIAKNSDNESHAVWALRAYIRVISLPKAFSYQEMLARLKKAMELATRDDERRLIISRAPSARDVETLRWLLPMLDDEALSAQTCRAIVDLAHYREVMEPNQVEFHEALNKVIAKTDDQRLIDRAKAYMTGL